MTVRRRLAVAAGSLALALTVTATLEDAPPVQAACDGSHLGATQLDRIFSRPGIGATETIPGYAGGDYQRTYELPDGRVLWLFQDMFLSNDDDLRDSLTAAAHNNGLVQDGTCFRVLGPANRNHIGHDLTVPLQRWFWPLDGEIGRDGRLWVFVAEMANPNGTGAGPGARPVATWLARIDVDTLQVVSFTPAPQSSAQLYGWSVVSDRRWSYLYGWCYRQFTEGTTASVAQFDPDCMSTVVVARVPAGRFDARPSYWNGRDWVRSARRAVAVSDRASSNPPNVRRFGPMYVNVSKSDDWWGLWIHVDVAPTPTGPWETRRSIWIVDDRRCEGCGLYHAQAARSLVDGRLLISTSNGAAYELWYRNAWLYRPDFRSITLPRYQRTPSLRGADLSPSPPATVLDTQASSAPVALGEVRVVDLGRGSSDIGSRLVVRAIRPSRGAQVRVWSCGSRPPTRPTLDVRTDATVSATVDLAHDGRVCVASSSTAHVRIRAAGTFSTS